MLKNTKILNSCEFNSLILDSIPEDIVVIDELGEIQYFNSSWSKFAKMNACTIQDWGGVNYLEECDKASAMGDDYGTKAGNGIRSIIEKRDEEFYLEYPCHSPDEKRWFMMRVSSFQLSGSSYFVISHNDITERKLEEEEINALSRMDGLTKIPNRRIFDEFLHEEWRRCSRLGMPLSLAIVDIDYLKLINDTYGHQYGDKCLIKIGELLKKLVNRPGDLCARYGGDEFAIVWGNTDLRQAKHFTDKLMKDVVELNIPNSKSPTEGYLTLSIGLAELAPNKGDNRSDIISKADSKLYIAKAKGRNRIES